TCGEFAYDRSFGCQLWNNDFDLQIVTGNWAKEIENMLADTIQKYETRLFPELQVNVVIENISTADDQNQKKKFLVSVSNMVLKETNERINDIDFSIVFSPINMQ
ncbi:MAG: hypothetical protein AAGK97_18950, partial [Bacteroidota bacterium]